MIPGDFNLPEIDWKRAVINYSLSLELSLKLLRNEFELRQSITTPSRSGNMLDVILISESFARSVNKYCPPIASSDPVTQSMLF